MAQLYFYLKPRHNNNVNKKNRTILIINSTMLVLFLLFTNPYRLPLLLIVVPGINVLLITYVLLHFITIKAGLRPILRRLLLAVALSTLSVAGVLLSLGQFTPRDFILLFSFTMIGIFYVYRMWDTKS
jgi:hypothetical protein